MISEKKRGKGRIKVKDFGINENFVFSLLLPGWKHFVEINVKVSGEALQAVGTL